MVPGGSFDRSRAGGPGVGGTFRATTNRLQGISTYLDRPPDRAELALYEVAAGGRTLGPELARGKAVGVDEYGMAAFTFDPIADSAGKEYGFVFTCPACRGSAAAQSAMRVTISCAIPSGCRTR